LTESIIGAQPRQRHALSSHFFLAVLALVEIIWLGSVSYLFLLLLS
jgi:hypothetical protein